MAFIEPLRFYDSWPFWQGIELFGRVPLTLYGLAYMAGLLLGTLYAMQLARRYPSSLTPNLVNDFLLYAIFGVVLGGRIGFAVFYPSGLGPIPWYQVLNPFYGGNFGLSGMSFHGGMIGVALALLVFWWVRRRGFHPLALMDLAAAAAPIGLYFGRLANFFNRELYGREAPDWWPFKLQFGTGADRFPPGCPGRLPAMCDLSLYRHPSQLYEAALEGAVLFAILAWLFSRDWARKQLGFITGAFLAGYGFFRFLIEYVRQPDLHVINAEAWFTRGQQLSLPMMLLGILLMVLAWRGVFGTRT